MDNSEKFIVLSEFQIWAEPDSMIYPKLNKKFIDSGAKWSHPNQLYSKSDSYCKYFKWDFSNVKKWVDEAIYLNAFNLFNIGEDIQPLDKGRLSLAEGINPELKDFFFKSVSYAKKKGFIVGIEPHGSIREIEGRENYIKWLKTFIGANIPKEERVDIIKLGVGVMGGYEFKKPNFYERIEEFILACKEVNPEVLVYIDSMFDFWAKVQPFHRWLWSRFPGMILSHYLTTSHIEEFRNAGFNNLMVQINPNETETTASYHFIFHDNTVKSLLDLVKNRIKYISLSGINYGYSRYNYDLFLEVVRPHLNLVKNLDELKKTIVPDKIIKPATKEEVREWVNAFTS